METLTRLSASLEAVRSHVEALAAVEIDAIEPLEKAKLLAALAFVVDSLFVVHLRLSEKSAFEHPILGELSRLKAYMAKIAHAESDRAELQAYRGEQVEAKKFIPTK